MDHPTITTRRVKSSTMKNYDDKVLDEVKSWQKKIARKPSSVDRTTKKLQRKLNSLLPLKVQDGITKTIKEMVRVVLFGARLTTGKPVKNRSLEAREAVIEEKIKFYKKAAAAEGGITGAGGILLSLADFSILLSMKIKMLYEIAAQYGFSVKDYRERLYILHIFQLAFSSQEKRRIIYERIENWEEFSQGLPTDINQFDWKSFQVEYRDYIDLAKLAQMIPLIGAPVGFIVNYRLISILGETAMNSYRMRLIGAVVE